MPPGRPWPDVLATLQRWGMLTCGAVARLPAADLQARLGDRGLWLQRLAVGIDPRPLRVQPPDDDFSQSLALEWPIDGLEPLSFVLGRVLDPLCAHLEARDRAAAVVRVSLHLTDRQVHTRDIELPVPVRESRVLRTLLLLDLEAHPPHAAIDRVTVAVDAVPGRIVQFSLLRKALPSDDQLAALQARLTALMGAGRCGAPALVDSYRPGDVALAPFVPSGTEGQDAGVAACWRRSGSRRRATPGVPEETPANRPARAGWTRRDTTCAGCGSRGRSWWSLGSEAHRRRRSASASGRATPRFATAPSRRPPARGDRRGRGGSRRTDVDGAWDRDEWDIALESGAAYRIFQDRKTGQWWVEGEID